MSSTSSVVNVTIAQSIPTVTSQSFGVPLIMGPTNPGWASADYVHTYTSASGLLTDGFSAGSPEVAAANALFNGPIGPTTFLVGKRSTVTTASDTFTVATLTTGHVYAFTINGVAASYTAQSTDTQQTVLGQLATLVNNGTVATASVTGSGSGATLTITGTTAGVAINYTSIDSLLTHTVVTQGKGIATDLANVTAQNSTWYGLLTPSASDSDILQAASFVESNKKLYVALSGTAAIATSSTTDVASNLKTSGYNRTALFYSPANLTTYPDATWVGSKLPQTPGSNNWAYVSLPGQATDNLSQTAVATLIGAPLAGTKGKNANIYQSLGGASVTMMGTAASGQYLDITIGLDWLQSTMTTNIFAAVTSAQKIPYTDAGVAVLMQAVTQTISQGVANGLIDGTTARTVTAPSVLSVSATQRANRIAPTITFTCRLQGAIDAVNVVGTVSI